MFRRFQSMANRVILGIIAAASINALAVLLTISGQSELERWAGIAFIVGLAAVAFTGILLVWGLFHPGQD
jgi:amino acid transporter